MATPLYDPKLSAGKFKNWIKAGLAVLFTKEGIEPFVYDEIKQFQQKCLSGICNNNGLPAGTTCSSCCTENVVVCPTNRICNVGRGKCSFHRNSATQYLPFGCPNKICHNFKSEIQRAHRYYGPSYKNTDATQWCSNPWEVAKCFMPPDGYKDATNAAETDFNGIITVILTYEAFQTKIYDDLSKPYNIFEQGREVAKAVRHSPCLEVEDTDLQHYFSILQKLLSDPAYLSANTNAQNAKTKLLQLQNDTLVIGTDVVRKVLDSVAKAVQDEIGTEMNVHKKEAEKKKLELIKITRTYIKVINKQGKVSMAQLDKALQSANDEIEKQRRKSVKIIQAEAQKQLKIFIAETDTLKEIVTEQVNELVQRMEVDAWDKRVLSENKNAKRKIKEETNEEVKRFKTEANARANTLETEANDNIKTVASEAWKSVKQIEEAKNRDVKEIPPELVAGRKLLASEADIATKQVEYYAVKGVIKLEVENETGVKQIEESADDVVNKLEVETEAGVKQIEKTADKGVKKLEVKAEAGVKQIISNTDDAIKQIGESTTANKEDKYNMIKEDNKTSQWGQNTGRVEDAQALNRDGLLPNVPEVSDRVFPLKCSWENVRTVEEARVLISDGVLPNEHGLSELVHRLGRKSDIVKLLCKSICKKIEVASPAFTHVFAAYALANQDKLHFVVLLENESSSDVNLDYEILFRSGKGDEKTEHEHMTKESEGELLADESTAVRNTINTISKQYMENHKYLSAITARKICLNGREKLCILMYVHPCTDRYSSIPYTEEPLPTEIQGYKVVVRNGVFKTATKTATEYHDNLRMGCQITSNLVDSFGTLGGFIDHSEYGLCGFTCAHVVCSSAQMIKLKRTKRLKWSTSEDPCLVYQPTKNTIPVGRVVETVYTEGGDSGSAGVDLALFQIENRPPVSGTSPCCSSNEKLQYVTGKTWGRSRIIHSACEVQKFGVVTGITQGNVRFDGMSVRELSFVTKSALHSVDTILYNQYEIVNDTRNFSEQGDSGGLVFMKDCTNELMCIGMVNGVLDTINPFHGVVTPITEILRELNALNLKPFRNEVKLDNLENKISVQMQNDFQIMQSLIRESVSTVARDMFAKMMEEVKTTVKSEVQSSMSQMYTLLQKQTSDSNKNTATNNCDGKH
ncbi:uncharacterized protein LOC128558439 isoform X2 [Mercenaria mercenaria]|uniref:uncharacterized protein LOC128558439 isoform X2 n=1 Tax=Mercenaria mercenaria TaxID=6596 RepID=UPI00234EDC00|nr:uncharacterized protein LOC128558439 isoform X2 [Mercenaria mercenaria]